MTDVGKSLPFLKVKLAGFVDGSNMGSWALMYL
jgi:hypothetical protein